MSTIVTRVGKGSPLTWTEVDSNFTNLNTDKLQSGNTAASLTITSATINGGSINGTTVGASTASSGAFTTLSASSTVSGTGFSTYLASPPAIGGTAPAAGAFTTLSATGVTTVQAGTVSLPAITTTGDTNTGMFFPAADTIAFAEGGAEAMRLDSSGNVGIGTTSPSGKLDITQATNGNVFVVNAPGGSTPNFTVQGSGEQTFRLYNSASTGSTRTSIKLASRLNTDWEWIAFTDLAGTGVNDLTISNISGTVLTLESNKNLKLYGGYTEAVVATGTVGSSATLSLANGTFQTATLTSATACTFTMPTNVAGKSFILLLRQPASGTATTATFTGVKWPAAGAPTITATVGRMDILTFVADGTNWYGSYAQGYTP